MVFGSNEEKCAEKNPLRFHFDLNVTRILFVDYIYP